MSFAKLDTHCRRLESLDHAMAMLGVDEAVNMPAGGGEKRAEAMAGLAALHHEIATAPEVADWLSAAEGEDLDATKRAAVREFRRVHTNLTCLTADFVNRQVSTRLRSEQLWRVARAANDWQGFLPALTDVIALAREEAARRAEVLGLAPYDAMMEQYDPGNRAADVEMVFAALKTFLKSFLPKALERQKERFAARPPKAMEGPFPIEAQKALGLELMAAIGFDLDHGRLDISHHPFCGGVPSDVRMTTRYQTNDFLSALMGILHETGHGLYEQNLPQAWQHQPVGKARGMMMHESQSLFVEKQIARHPAFWAYALPLARKHLGAHLGAISLEDLMQHVHRVKPGLIRVDADEATYPLHVILRFELEQQLITGKIEAKDLPEAWHSKMMDYFGLATIDTPKDGPMQDVHWPSGAFGYFPSYTLGALAAAQQFAAIKRAYPAIEDDMAAGRFDRLNAWRNEHIWAEASFHSTPDLMVRATGEPLNARHFMRHLEQRYLA
jgi:carboxypeptidase Taq